MSYLTEHDIDYLERYAHKHGLAATLDHLGLDGLGNQVTALQATAEASQRYLKTNTRQNYLDLHRALATLENGGTPPNP